MRDGRLAFRNRVRIQLGDADLRDVNAALQALPEKMRRKVARKGMREVMQRGRQVARALAPAADRDTKRAVAIKVQTYRRRTVWGAVGVRVGGPFTPNKRFGEAYPGWRSHLWDGGFRVWQKGVRADGRLRVPKPGNWKPNPSPKLPAVTRRGWRKGKARRNLAGRVIGRLLYLTRTAQYVTKIARDRIVAAVGDALKEAGRGN